jgi:predicted amidohydrolase
MMNMQLIGVQLNTVWEDKAASHQRVRDLLAKVKVRPGAMIVLSEFFATGFSNDIAAVAEPPDGESHAFLAELAQRTKAHVLGGVVTPAPGPAPGGRGRNQCVVCDPTGNEVARYGKVFPFTFGGEKEHYDAGDELVMFQVGKLNVAPFICYDLRFPEVFRRMAKQGAQLYTVIANWPGARREHWTTLLRARAIENQAYVIGVNRCGTDPHHDYTGDSMIIDPRGTVLADAASFESVIVADVDPTSLDDYRRQFPALDDMRPEFCSW